MTDDNLPLPDAEQPADELDWEDDTLMDTLVNKEFDGDGYVSVYYYFIQDMSFADAWVKSSESRNLQKMR